MSRADYEDRDDGSRSLGKLIRLDEFETQEADRIGASQFSAVTSLEDEQNDAFNAILEWLRQYRSVEGTNLKQLFVLGGYAGTGKTTLLGFLAAHLVNTLKLRVAFCTLTGKASTILSRSLKACGVTPEFCGTIHRMMYKPVTDETTGEVTGWEQADEVDYDLVVVDEASMLSGEILEDMRALHIPVLACGDHGQLPPVGEDVSIMQNPDARLEKVRRQAMENPIIALSLLIRHNRNWRDFIKNCRDPRLKYVDKMDVNYLVAECFEGFLDRPLSADPLVLCATNRTRAVLNKAARMSVKSDDILVRGDRIICLRNAYLSNLLLANGFRGKVTGFGYSPNPMQLNVKATFSDEGLELRDGMMCRSQFGADKTIRSFLEVSPHMRSWKEVGLLFDYGNAMTVHKAQGSQADDGILFVERFQGSTDEFNRHLYTGATRIIKNLTVAF